MSCLVRYSPAAQGISATNTPSSSGSMTTRYFTSLICEQPFGKSTAWVGGGRGWIPQIAECRGTAGCGLRIADREVKTPHRDPLPIRWGEGVGAFGCSPLENCSMFRSCCRPSHSVIKQNGALRGARRGKLWLRIITAVPGHDRTGRCLRAHRHIPSGHRCRCSSKARSSCRTGSTSVESRSSCPTRSASARPGSGWWLRWRPRP